MAQDLEERAEGKRPREPLNRERILEAALRLVDRDGLDGLSMRKLAHELGVEAMSLYNHIPNKAAILNGILERVMSEFDLPEDEGLHWTHRIRAMARTFRQILKRHPGVIPLFGEHREPVLLPSVLRPVEVALDILRRAGLSGEATAHALHTLESYTMGYVLMEVGGLLLAEHAQREGHPVAAEMARMLPPGELPRFAEMLPLLMACDPDTEFEHGLDLILAGLQARLERSPS